MPKTNFSIPEKQLYGLLSNAVPLVLFVSHNRGGGVEKHIQELISILPEGTDSITLKPASDGSRCVVVEYAGQPLLFFDYQKEQGGLADFLAKIDLIHVHIHHTKGFSSAVLELVTSLGLSWDYTVHDYYSICPQINLIDKEGQYCQERGEAECAKCLNGRPSPGKMTIQEWRKKNKYFVEQAKRCFVPSMDVRLRMQQYFSDANYVTLYHENNVNNKVFKVKKKTINRLAQRHLRVAVIGALTPMKGANLLEATAIDARQRGLPVDFLLIGDGYRQLVTQPMSQLDVVGRYDDCDLQHLLTQSQADVIWFTACWPETYSYTLSAALVAGLPVVAPNIGSFQERLSQTLLSWIVPWNLKPIKFNDFFVSLRERLQQEENKSFDEQFVGVLNGGEILLCDDFFNYRSDYIDSENIKKKSIYIDVDLLFDLLRFKTKPPFNLLSFVKYRFLMVLIQLRTTTLLSWMVRKIPQSFQTRLKGWLLGESNQ